MILPKRTSLPKEQIIKMDISSFQNAIILEKDENMFSNRTGKMKFNFATETGALTTGFGIQTLSLPKATTSGNREIEEIPCEDAVDSLWHVNFFSTTNNEQQNMVMCHTTGNEMFAFPVRFDHSTVVLITTLPEFESKPTTTNYRIDGVDVVLLTSKTEGLCKWNPEQLTISTFFENAPKIISCCKHYERLFAIEAGRQNKLLFSDDLDPTNWDVSLDEGGFVEFVDEGGRLLKLISFLDYVFIFREFGIERLCAFGEQTDFSISHLTTSCGKICASSICVCGDRVIFLASDGLHMFNGSTVQKIDVGVDPLFEGVDNSNCATAFHNGKFFLACRMNFFDDAKIGVEENETYTNNALFVMDAKTGEFEISRGFDVAALAHVHDDGFSEVVCSIRGTNKIGMIKKCGAVFDEPLEKVWKSAKTNFGMPDQKKIVKEIVFTASSDGKVTVVADSTTSTFPFKGGSSSIRIQPKMKGESIQISFSTTKAECTISRPQIVCSVVEK